MEDILLVKNLNKKYKDFRLDNISFELQRGYIMGFIGPNGAGKSTTIKLIMNLIKKDSGEIKILGLDSIKDEVGIKNKIGFVYDENCFYEELTVDETKKLISPFYKKWDEGAYKKYINMFGIPNDRKIKELSKGMKMKFSIAMALSHNAELFIMDEPTSGLDPVIRSELMDILSFVIEDGEKSVFFSTHITSDLERIADYITFLNNGKIVFSEGKDVILDRYALIKGEKEISNKGIRDLCIGFKENNYGFSALTSNKNQVTREFRDKVIIDRPTLDDIMVFYKRSELNA